MHKKWPEIINTVCVPVLLACVHLLLGILSRNGHIQVGEVCINILSVDFSAEAFSPPCGVFLTVFHARRSEERVRGKKKLTTQEM